MPNRYDVIRWQSDREAWNKWAESEEASSVDFSGFRDRGNYIFDGFVFPKEANFSGINCLHVASFKGCKFLGAVNFSNAHADSFDFSDAEFSESVTFESIRCKEKTSFQGAVFASKSNFNKASFSKGINFLRAQFNAPTTFDDSRLSEVNFEDCVFETTASFQGAVIKPGLFKGASFNGEVVFDTCAFQSDLNFSNASFSGETVFRKCKFTSGSNFSNIKLRGKGSFTLDNNEITGDIVFSDSKFVGAFAAKRIMTSRAIKFRQCSFSSDADFSNSNFLNTATFSGCHFFKSSKPVFDHVTFHGNTSFKKMTSDADISFNNGKIEQNGMIDFAESTFGGKADFSFFEFLRPASFIDSRFNGSSNFRNIRSTFEFDLASSKFHDVPNFLFAEFSEPPSFEGVSVSSPLKRRWPNLEKEPRNIFIRWMKIAEDEWVSQKYRKLKSLAIAGHDHRGELEFFAAEIQSKRFWHDKFGSLPFVAGILYEVFSKFGRNALRPFSWWFLSLIAFCLAYLKLAKPSACDSEFSPIWDAAFVSLMQGLPFLFWGRSETAKHISNCLFSQTALPASVVGVAIAQNLVSTVFIFLFFLALRNQFKIR